MDPQSSSANSATTAAADLHWTEKDSVKVPVSQFLPLLTSFDEYQDKLSHIVDGEQSMNPLDDSSQPPATHLVQELRMGGKTNMRQNFVQFDLEFRVSVLVDHYNTCPLIPISNSITVLDSRVQLLKWVENSKNNKNTNKQTSTLSASNTASSSSDNDNNEQQDMQVLPNYFDSVVDSNATREASDEKNVSSSSTKSPLDTHGRIGIVSACHSLISRGKGLYSIFFTISVPFLTKQKRSVEMTLPRQSVAARTRMTDFSIQGDMQVQVEPSTYLETKVITKGDSSTTTSNNSINNALLNFDDDEDDTLDETIDSHETVIVECILPSVSQLTIYWTKNEPKKEETETPDKKVEQVKERKPLTVNVDQYALHSVGGGIVSTSVDFNFQIHNGSYDTFYISMNTPKKSDKNIRVLRVEGRNIKKWEMKKLRNNENATASDATSESGISNATSNSFLTDSTLSSALGNSLEQSICKVTLETGVEGNYQLKLFTEVDMDGESAKVHIPTFACLNVNREKGFIGIEATSSVEIKELSSRLTTKLDTRELPSEMTNKASDQLILAYKFLQSKGVSLFVDVKKHDDVSVLVAVIEEAYYEVTYSESGHYLYRVALKVKNSSQDYIKAKFLDINDDSKQIQISLWSTTVDGSASRPARDKEGFILIPLKRSSSETVFTVEMFYLYNSHSAIEGKGSLELFFPTFNTPITRGYYNVNLPDDFNYGEFEGDIKECKNWEKYPSVLGTIAYEKQKLAYNNNNNNARMPVQMQQQMQQQYAMPQQMQYAPQQQMQYAPQPQMNYNAMNMVQPQMAQQMRNAPRRPQYNINANFNEDDDEQYNDSASDSDEEDEALSESDEEQEEGGEVNISNNLKSSSVVGVLPIVLNSVSNGKNFKFEKLLVSETEPSQRLHVEFKQIVKSWREKRTLWRQDLAAWMKYKRYLFFVVILLVVVAIVSRFIRRH